jgi:hypothetical protein
MDNVQNCDSYNASGKLQSLFKLRQQVCKPSLITIRAELRYNYHLGLLCRESV